jgi:GNAT superfamily N-acetyltransferase
MPLSPRIRQADPSDVEELARLRWQSTIEDGEATESWETFLASFQAFAQAALASPAWSIWVLADGQALLGTVYIQIVAKVPRPNDNPRAYGYVTGVYLEPSVRNRGLGSRLLEAAIANARLRGLDLLLLWPSERSVAFYERLGFGGSAEAMELPFGQDKSG